MGIKLNAGADDRNNDGDSDDNDDNGNDVSPGLRAGGDVIMMIRCHGASLPLLQLQLPALGELRAAQSADLYYCHVYGQIGIEIETSACLPGLACPGGGRMR